MINIQFYNIKGSPNLVEMGPFDSVVCDGTEVVGVTGEKELTLASYDHDHEGWHVYEHSAAPIFLRYLEVKSPAPPDLLSVCERVLKLINCHQVYDKDAQSILERAIARAKGEGDG